MIEWWRENSDRVNQGGKKCVEQWEMASVDKISEKPGLDG